MIVFVYGHALAACTEEHQGVDDAMLRHMTLVHDRDSVAASALSSRLRARTRLLYSPASHIHRLPSKHLQVLRGPMLACESVHQP